MIDENKNKYISLWLLLITSLVSLIIIVGGITRLTDSGLSITRWDLFTGILPPFTFEKWEYFFSLYKEIPEFKLIYSSMTLEEFKVIFWWEYIHRLLGRLIGLFYIIPLIYITLKKVLNIKKLFSLYLIFFLICLQGFVGWYMVQSGLTERTDVSQYRLSLHLTLAFTIFSLLIWNFLDYKNINNSHNNIKIPFLLPIIFFFLLILQISLGAFVSGLDAGTIYQTWPLMEGSYFPNDSNYVDLFTKFFFDTPSLVQFMHRNIAYLLFLTFLIIFILVIKNKKYFYYRKTIFLIFAALVIQIILGIITVLSGAAIIWASLHQIGSILLTTASIVFLYKNYKIN